MSEPLIRKPGDQTCNACVHWQHFGDKFTDKDGVCTRHAPRPVEVPECAEYARKVMDGDPPGEFCVEPSTTREYIARWPWTRAWDRCGEFVRDELEDELVAEGQR